MSGPARHGTTTPWRFWLAYISATAGPFHVRSSLVGTYIPSAVKPDDPDLSGFFFNQFCAEWWAPLSRWLQWRWWTRDVPRNIFCYFSSTLRGLYGKNWPWRIKSGARYHVSDVVVDVTELAFLALVAWFSSAGAYWHLLTALALECVTQNMSKMRHDIDLKYQC